MKLINDFLKWLFVDKWRGDYCFSLHDVCEDVGIAISEKGNIWIVNSFKMLSLISHLFSSIVESNRDGLTHANAVNTWKCSAKRIVLKWTPFSVEYSIAIRHYVQSNGWPFPATATDSLAPWIHSGHRLLPINRQLWWACHLAGIMSPVTAALGE